MKKNVFFRALPKLPLPLPFFRATCTSLSAVIKEYIKCIFNSGKGLPPPHSGNGRKKTFFLKGGVPLHGADGASEGIANSSTWLKLFIKPIKKLAIYLFWTTTFIISIMTTHTCIILDMSWTWPHITVVISPSEQHHCIVTILVPVATTVHLNLNSPKLPPLLIFHLIQWSCYKLVQKRSECLIKILH